MIALIGLWSHALAAILYGALALWQLRYWGAGARSHRLFGAFAAMAVWGVCVALVGPTSVAAGVAEAGRNFAFLGFMFAIFDEADGDRQPAVKLVYTVLAAVIGLQLTLAGVIPGFENKPLVHEALAAGAQVIGLIVAAGSLVLVHNLYGQAAPDSRWGIRLPMIALAAMWIYDLHLYTVAYLSREPVADLVAMRGAVLAMLVPLFALSTRRNTEWRIQISRAATFQSLSVIGIFAYLLLMMSATRILEVAGGHWVRIGQVAVISAMTLVATVLVPSGRMRAWTRVMLAKHLFEHRYDYRDEWLRFTRTIGIAGEDQAPLAQRIVKALADIAEAPGGLLLAAEADGRFSVGAEWRWRHAVPRCNGSAELIRALESHAFVIDLESARGGRIRIGETEVAAPDWLASIEDGWAGIPLLHNDRLVGLVILEHPLVRRPLDWEDFDLFRTVGMQAASYLAEARGQEALADAQRFDEFNRRFAFIMHDVKNLVSQLSLVIRNAERHADKPEFRQDMIATLESSVKKMNDLLARLSRGGSNVEAEPVRAVSVASSVASVAEVKRRVHPVDVEGDAALAALADPSRLAQALMHLVQNAIDASPGRTPVTIRYDARGRDAAIEVADRGHGMSAEFIRTRLFQPFASTKESGFGVGAYEAKGLVAAIGGRLEVESREGEGTRFTIFLPLAESAGTLPERKYA
jgi:putative PEP-CTERM system histidine kinase